jgi:hypothetical protein
VLVFLLLPDLGRSSRRENMTVRVLALASGVTSLESHRHGLAPLSVSAGVLNGRSGIYPDLTAADLGTVSAMVASIAPFSAWVDGTSTGVQGGYSFTSDASVNITFDAGNASTTRTDRVIARVRDNPYDASGSQAGSVEYLKGNTTTGVATAVPASSLLLWEVSVPAGASAGGGGINFSTQKVDKRVYTAARGGTFNIGSQTDEDAIASPHIGMRIFRTDLKYFKVYNGSNWCPEPGTLLARGRRSSSSPTTSGTIGVLRVDNIPVVTGCVYEITTNNIYIYGSNANNTGTVQFKYSTSGTATTSSTNIDNGLQLNVNTVQPYTGVISCVLAPGVTGTMSILMCLTFTSGTGTVNTFGDSAFSVKVVSVSDPGDTGVDI